MKITTHLSSLVFLQAIFSALLLFSECSPIFTITLFCLISILKVLEACFYYAWVV